jgi:uncharacterized RDD family membrane protein YckC
MSTQPTATSWSVEAPEWDTATARFTGIALRAVALLVDLALWSVYWGVLLSAGRSLNGPILSLMLIVPPILYFPLAWGRFGTTVGMRFLRLRIVRAADGGRIGYGTAAVRAVICLVLVVSSVALVGIALFALPMVTDHRRRGIHDRMAGTLVVRPAQFSGWRVLVALALAFAIVAVVLWFILGGGGSAV